MVVRIPDREVFLEAALTRLREHDFTPRRVEWDLGLAIAGPSVGGQWFEIWRSDVHGPYQILESSMHTIRREVTLRVEPEAGSGPRPDGAAAGGASGDASGNALYRVGVEVEKSRYSAPERQVTVASAALGLYSTRRPTEAGRIGADAAAVEWVPLGRDVLLEAYLLDQIVAATPGAEPVTQIAPARPPAGGASTSD